jgi:outer membrane lipoprotein-sorting protein
VRRIRAMKKICLLLILVIFLLPFTACEGEMPPADEVIEKVVGAMSEVETFRQDMGMTMQLYVMAEDTPSFFPLDIDIELNAESANDLVNNNAETVMDIVITGEGDDSIKMEVALYIVDETIYVMVDYPIISPMWMKSSLPVMFSQQMGDYQTLMEVLQMAGLEVTGAERKEGVSCYVLETTPDLGQIFKSLMQPAGEYDTEFPESDLEIIDEIFQDFSIKMWVDKNDYRIIYMEINLQMELSPEMVGEYDEEGLFSLDAAIKMHFHDYNRSVKIDLPPEAENADEAFLW